MDQNFELFRILKTHCEAVLAERDGVVWLANAAAEKLFGEGVVGRIVSEVLPAEIAEAEIGENGIVSQNIHLRAVDGTVTAIEISGVRFFSIAVSGKKHELSDFASALSSAIRSPASNLCVTTGMISSVADYLNSDENAQYIAMIMRDCKRMARLAENLSLFSEMEEGKYKYRKLPIDFAGLCADITNTAAALAKERGVEVAFSSKEAPIEICADKYAMEILLLNLLSNAIKYAGRGGKVSVAVVVFGDRLRLNVSDNGIGMSPEVMGSLFSQYLNAGMGAQIGQGAGIGLSLVSKIARAHGGVALAESREGAGTTVTVLLPLNGAEAGEEQSDSIFKRMEGMNLILTQLSDALGYKSFYKHFLG